MKKVILAMLAATTFSGCAALRDFSWQRHSWDGGAVVQQTQDDIHKMAARQHELGFKRGVQRNIETTIRQHGNTAPYIGWEYPIYQDVTIPTEVRGGALYLRHVEPVMMQPGAYMMYHAQPFEPEVRQQYVEPRSNTGVRRGKAPDYHNRYSRTITPVRGTAPTQRYSGGILQASYNPDRYTTRYRSQ